MECLVCLRNWDSKNCVPKSLACGHSFCVDCLEALIIKGGDGVLCPFCQVKHKMSREELDALPKNFSLLALVRDKTDFQKLLPTASLMDKPASSPPIIVNDELQKIEKMVSAKPYCEKHKLLVHSYIPGKNRVLCDKCLAELPPSVTSISPIPKVCRDLKFQIQQAKSQVSYNKIIIKRYKQVIRSLFDSNKKDVESRISEHFQKINEILNECEQQVREQYKNMQFISYNEILFYNYMTRTIVTVDINYLSVLIKSMSLILFEY